MPPFRLVVITMIAIYYAVKGEWQFALGVFVLGVAGTYSGKLSNLGREFFGGSRPSGR
jgi:hypothetical protein